MMVDMRPGGALLAFVWAVAGLASSPAAARNAAENEPRPRLLFMGEERFPIVGPTYAQRLARLGYPIDARRLDAFELKTLQRFNVLVFTQFRVGRTRIGKMDFGRRVAEQLAEWVRAGGGLFFMPGLMGYGDHAELTRRINALLQPFGASILREQVEDPRHQAEFRGILNYTYYSTRNFAESPLTRGLRTLWYPGGGGQHAAPVAAGTMRLGNDWQVLVRGEKTASSRTVSSAPPLVAVRQWGRGRVALATFDPRYFINDGCHPAYGGYTLDKGDGFRLLRRLYDWLGGPSIRAGRVFPGSGPLPASATRARRTPPVPKPDVGLAELRRRLDALPWNSLRTFKGVIGVHSTLSDGRAPVDTVCNAARKLGFDFLVFTEAFEHMNERKWRRLVAACEAAAGRGFLAVPGLEIRDDSGVRIAFNLSRFPRADEIGERRWARLLFNLDWPSILVSEPGRNRLSPWQLRFYTGIALMTYDRGDRIDDARALYRDLSASDYRLIPVVVNRIYDVRELRAVQNRAVTLVHARELGELTAHKDWKHAGPLRTMYGCGTSYVGSGIVLERFGVATSLGGRVFAGAYPVGPSHNELVRIALRSPSPILEVKVFRGTRLYRRFRPGAREFKVDVAAATAAAGDVWTVEARDASGRALHSNALRKPYSGRFHYTMCVDKQNSIIDLSGLGMAAGWIAGGDVGAIFPLLPSHEIVPAGEDASWCPVNSWEVRPEFGLDRQTLSRLKDRAARTGRLTRRCRLSSEDCIVMEDAYDTAFVRASIQTLYFRPRERGINMLIVEHDIRILKNIPLSRSREWVRLFRIQTNTAMNPYPRYAMIQGGRVAFAGDCRAPATSGDRELRRMRLGRGDGAILFPSPAGNIGVFSLSDRGLVARVGTTTNGLHAFVSGSNKWRNFLEIGVVASAPIVRKGERFRTRLLFVLDNRGSTGVDALVKLPGDLGVRGSPAYRIVMQHGDPTDTGLPVELRARGGVVRVRLEGLVPSPGLPVVVRGVNATQDAVVYDAASRVVRHLGTVGDSAYVLLPSAGGEFVIGNAMTCAPPDVVVSVLRDGPRWRVFAHNPTDKAVKGEFRSAMEPFSGFGGSVDLGACSTRELVRLGVPQQ
ncbi:MAG: hypothetical protein GXP31_00870 [Kiritimatiellaeota bacterium]|nr:hypothetical protein [Kiritimatiellota bacterium]